MLTNEYFNPCGKIAAALILFNAVTVATGMRAESTTLAVNFGLSLGGIGLLVAKAAVQLKAKEDLLRGYSNNPTLSTAEIDKFQETRQKWIIFLNKQLFQALIDDIDKKIRKQIQNELAPKLIDLQNAVDKIPDRTLAEIKEKMTDAQRKKLKNAQLMFNYFELDKLKRGSNVTPEQHTRQENIKEELEEFTTSNFKKNAEDIIDACEEYTFIGGNTYRLWIFFKAAPEEFELIVKTVNRMSEIYDRLTDLKTSMSLVVENLRVEMLDQNFLNHTKERNLGAHYLNLNLQNYSKTLSKHYDLVEKEVLPDNLRPTLVLESTSSDNEPAAYVESSFLKNPEEMHEIFFHRDIRPEVKIEFYNKLEEAKKESAPAAEKIKKEMSDFICLFKELVDAIKIEPARSMVSEIINNSIKNDDRSSIELVKLVQEKIKDYMKTRVTPTSAETAVKKRHFKKFFAPGKPTNNTAATTEYPHAPLTTGQLKQ